MSKNERRDMARNWRKTRAKHVAEQAIVEALEVARKQLEDPATAPDAIEKIIRLGEKLAKLEKSQKRDKDAASPKPDSVWNEVRRIEAKRDDGNEPFIMPDYPDPVVVPQTVPSLPATPVHIPPSTVPPAEVAKVPNSLSEQAREKLREHEAWVRAGRPSTRVLTEYEPPPSVYEPRLPSGIANRFPFCGSETPQKWPTWDQENGWTSVTGETERPYLARKQREQKESENSWY
jgi:hypothetical protein